jgi:hypothetical protein
MPSNRGDTAELAQNLLHLEGERKGLPPAKVWPCIINSRSGHSNEIHNQDKELVLLVNEQAMDSGDTYA